MHPFVYIVFLVMKRKSDSAWKYKLCYWEFPHTPVILSQRQFFISLSASLFYLAFCLSYIIANISDARCIILFRLLVRCEVHLYNRANFVPVHRLFFKLAVSETINVLCNPYCLLLRVCHIYGDTIPTACEYGSISQRSLF